MDPEKIWTETEVALLCVCWGGIMLIVGLVAGAMLANTFMLIP